MELTKSELEIMNVLWDAGRPLTRGEILELSVDKKWKDNSIHILCMKHKRNFIKASAGCVVDYAVFAYITEETDFIADINRDFFIAAGNNNIWMNTNSHKLLYRMLCRL